jgi:release factor glutamine methyltransferase
MMEAQRYITSELSGLYEEPELQSVSRLLLSNCTGFNFTGLLLNKNTTFSPFQWDKLKKMVELLKSGMPVQYATGETEFYGLRFEVAPGVLIPRPETEELVEWAVQNLPANARVLDIGTGSGCIAVTIRYLRPDCQVVACDVSLEALQQAAHNARLHQLPVTFVQLDVLTNPLPEGKWDLIISNPPYIPRQESESIESKVKHFEPDIALFVENNDPLVFYRRIAELSKMSLATNGQLLVETHRSYATDCVVLLQRLGFQRVELKKDISGNDRMIRALLN